MTVSIVFYALAALALLSGLILLVLAFLAPDHRFERGVVAVIVMLVAGMLLALWLMLANFNWTNMGPGMMFPYENPPTVDEMGPCHICGPKATPEPESAPDQTSLTVSDKVPGCSKVNASASSYEEVWLRSDGSGIYDVTSAGTKLPLDHLYGLAGKNPSNEDHDVLIWDPNTVVAIRGFELWDCGPIADVSIKAQNGLLDEFGYKKSESDNSVGVDHNIVIHYLDGTIVRYDNGADVPLPASMAGVDYASCTVTEPSHQNTPGDVLGGTMTSTLGAPGCVSVFVGTVNGQNVAYTWIGVIERFSYTEGDFWVMPAGTSTASAEGYPEIATAMKNLGLGSIANWK